MTKKERTEIQNEITEAFIRLAQKEGYSVEKNIEKNMKIIKAKKTKKI